MEQCRVLVNFFCVKGIKKKTGYLVDSIIVAIRRVSSSSEVEYFRGRSNSFEATLDTLKEVHTSCYMFMKGRAYRISSFSVLNMNDEIYVCEDKNKDYLQQFLLHESMSMAAPAPTVAIQRSSASTSSDNQETVEVGENVLKRKRSDGLKEKLRNHIAFEADPNYKNGPSRQQYLERETVNYFRLFKGMSLTEFHNEYNTIKWKTCK